MSKTEKKKGKVRKILLTVFTVIVTLNAVAAVVNLVLYKLNLKYIENYSPVEKETVLVPELDENNDWYFTTDGDLNVLTLTDLHIGGGWMSFNKDRKAINAVAAMVTAEKPDVIIITGDLAYPVFFQSGTFNNKTSASLCAALFEKLGVYWAPVFGNHDTELYSFYSREKIGSFYGSGEFEHCLFLKGPEEIDGVGNYIINVKNTAGIVTESLILMDSHTYTDGDYFGIFWKYDNIHQNQVDWYEQKIKALQQNNPDVKSLIFMHIPLVEFKDAFNEIKANDDKDTDDAKYISGVVDEKDPFIMCGIGEDNLFEKALELNSTQAFFFGHDHKNTLVLNYKGITFCYCNSTDYLAYPGISKLGDWRGCTSIQIHPDGSYSESHESYYQDKYVPLHPKEAVSYLNGK